MDPALKGQGFSRAVKPSSPEMDEMDPALKGHGFSRAVKRAVLRLMKGIGP
jgi:hypothetical protein